MAKVFITGEIGSGKSYITKRLSQYSSWPVLNIDAVVSSLYHDEVFCTLLTDLFGTCEKRKVSELVFKNPEQLAVLEAATANVIRQRVEHEMRQHANLLIEFPLLFEYTEYLDMADAVIYVTANEALRWERVSQRDGRTLENFKAINEKQLRVSSEQKRKRSTLTVENDGSWEITDAWCANVFNRYVFRNGRKYA